MNNYPVWWDKTITIYNKFVDPETQRVSWYRQTLENCFWKYVNNTYYIGTSGLSTVGVSLEAKDVICRIPKNDMYVDKRVWKDLESSARENAFTLANGDIIILGEVEEEIDEYTRGQRSTDLISRYKEYDACIEIETYVDNTGKGIGTEHYRVIGK